MSKTVHLSLLPKRNHSYYQNESSHNELTGTHDGGGKKNESISVISSSYYNLMKA